MPELRGYPAGQPRALRLGRPSMRQVREAYAAASRRRRFIHVVASAHLPRNPLVAPPSVEVAEAWSRVVENYFGDVDARELRGFISSPGALQRLVVTSPLVTVKANVFERGCAPLAAEHERITEVSAVISQVQASEFRNDGAFAYLVTETFYGRIPSWQDRPSLSAAVQFCRAGTRDSESDWVTVLCDECRARISRASFSAERFYWHGDFVPWNTRMGRNGAHVFDWEFADLNIVVPKHLLEAEWVLRGAASSGSSARTREVIREVLPIAGDCGLEAEALVAAYVCFSSRMRMSLGREDDDRLLAGLRDAAQDGPDCATILPRES